MDSCSGKGAGANGLRYAFQNRPALVRLVDFDQKAALPAPARRFVAIAYKQNVKQCGAGCPGAPGSALYGT
jgi:hypothetical protein